MPDYTQIKVGPQFKDAFEEVLDDITKDYLNEGNYVAWLQLRLDRGKVVGLSGKNA